VGLNNPQKNNGNQTPRRHQDQGQMVPTIKPAEDGGGADSLQKFTCDICSAADNPCARMRFAANEME